MKTKGIFKNAEKKESRYHPGSLSKVAETEHKQLFPQGSGGDKYTKGDMVPLPLRNINLMPQIEFLQSPERENPREARN